MRGWALAAAAALAIGGAAHGQEDPAAIEMRFGQAMAAEAAGGLAEAIAILTTLQERTEAPRIKLELARLLFRAGDYGRARAVFGEVYRQDLPYPVRRTVNLFLDDIDQRIGYFRPSFGIGLDDNPGQQPPSGIYDLFGFPFAYANTAEPATAVSWRLDGLAPFARAGERQWQLRASAEGAISEAAAGDRYAGEASLRRARLDLRSHWAAGLRVSETAGFRAGAAFVEYERRLTPRRDREWTLRAAVEANRFPDNPYLDGETLRLGVEHGRDLGPNTSLILGAGGSLSNIDDSQWPRVSVQGQATVVRSLAGRNLNLVAGVALSADDFEGRDLFFGRERADVAYSLRLGAYHGRPLLGFFPGLALTHEGRGSNIAFYDYTRTGLTADFRRRF